jgi:ornithine carbamoyltransferase
MKHFINLKDISSNDLRKILSDAKKRKKKRNSLNTLEIDKGSPLKGKLLIQMFEKSSLRTRLSFYLAIKQLGGGTLTLRANELHLGLGGETLEDTAKILSTYGDGFMLRTDKDKKIENFKKFLTIPVINGLSPSSHPTQVLSDIFTVEEIKKKPISKMNIAWVGDSNNVLNSLIAASIKFNFRLNIGCPKKYSPSKPILDWVKSFNNKINIFDNAAKAVSKVDVIFSDKVISLNDKVNKKKKLNDFKNFRITKKLMKKAKSDCIFLHCLPRGPEVDENVFFSKQSKVWQQALNRVHVQKSILLYCFGKLR